MEALLFLSHLKLNNVIVLIDRNKLITLGGTENICKLEPLDKKLSSFSFNVHKVNGHNFKDLIKLHNRLKKRAISLTLSFAIPIKGKGINFIENEHTSHHRVLNEKEFKLAMENFNA